MRLSSDMILVREVFGSSLTCYRCEGWGTPSWTEKRERHAPRAWPIRANISSEEVIGVAAIADTTCHAASLLKDLKSRLDRAP